MVHHRLAALLIAGAILGGAGSAAAEPAPPAAAPAFRHGGIGVGGGDPTALDFKFWPSRLHAVGFGFDLLDIPDVVGFYLEYEAVLHPFVEGARPTVDLYAGIGAHGKWGATSNGVITAALVIPIGVDLQFSFPLGLFAEARPGYVAYISSGGEQDFVFEWQVGARFMF